MPDAAACRACLATWPPGQTPKIHVSSQRAGATPGQHDDWIDAPDVIRVINALPCEHFDVMLEAKQKDLALVQRR
ncbi:MAG: hypothetical protein C4346_11675, partial [Chloroflexota bacterium]